MVSCKDLKQENNSPYFTSTWDTIVSNKNFILPGDKLILTHSLASVSETNTIIYQSKRLELDYVQFYGPDTDFVFTRSIKSVGKFVDKLKSIEIIPEGIRPGYYEFTSQAKDENGRFSNQIKFNFPVSVPAYPGIQIDSPVNGFRTVNKISTDKFKFKYQVFGSMLDSFTWQWFDSLKKDPASSQQVVSFENNETEFKKTDYIIAPQRTGKSFFLKVAVSNKDGRTSQYWIPFLRN